MPFRILIIVFLLICISENSYAQQWQKVDREKKELNSKYNLARKMQQYGQIKQAMNIYQYLLQKRPKEYKYYTQYIRLLFSTENYEKAAIVINTFIKNNPENMDAAIDLGQLYFMLGDSTRAYKHWDKSLEQFKSSRNYYRKLFYGMLENKIYDRAEQTIFAARKQYNDKNLFCYELANFYLMQGRYIVSAEEYLAYAHTNSRNYQFIARQILRFPDEEQVYFHLDSLFQKEARIVGKVPGLWQLHGDIAFKYKKYDKAKE